MGFQRIDQMDRGAGFPGARVILATGFRVRNVRPAAASNHVTSLLQRYRDGKISAEQAIREAGRPRPFFDIIPELQANFAFAKAYVADSDGSRGGLSGPQFYVDLSLFTTSSPPWLELGEPIQWHNDPLRLEAVFA